MKPGYIDYQDGDAALEGYLAWYETASEPRPVILVAHDCSTVYDDKAYTRPMRLVADFLNEIFS